MAGARKTTTAPEKDPQGGLTAAGRKGFAARDGSHLKPGVTKSDAEMSPEDMKRKGSWAVRFYGRAALPPLLDAKGEPTRFALSAHAWGEPVPKTEAEARRIAAKGRELLERYAATTGRAGKKAVAAAPAADRPVATPVTAGTAAAKETPARKTPARKTAAKKTATTRDAAPQAAPNAPAKKASVRTPPAKKAAAKGAPPAGHAAAKNGAAAGKAPAKKAEAS